MNNLKKKDCQISFILLIQQSLFIIFQIKKNLKIHFYSFIYDTSLKLVILVDFMPPLEIV